METIAAHPSSQKLRGNGSRSATSGMFRWNAVSKHATCGQVRVQLLHRHNRLDLVRQVVRGERDEIVELGQHPGIDPLGPAVTRSPVHDAMADGVEVLLQMAPQGVEEGLQGRGLVRHRHLPRSSRIRPPGPSSRRRRRRGRCARPPLSRADAALRLSGRPRI